MAKSAIGNSLETDLKVGPKNVPELARVLNAWALLPAEARQAILGIIDDHKPTDPTDSR